MKNSNQHLLWHLSRGHRRRYASAILVMGIGIVLGFGIPLLTRAAIDGPLHGALQLDPSAAGARPAQDLRLAQLADALQLAPGAELWIAGALFVLLSSLVGVCLYLRSRWAAVASEGMVAGLRRELFRHLANLPSAYHDGADTGDLVQRCTSDVETVRMFLSSQVVEIGRAILMVGIAMPILFSLDTTLAWISLALFPLIVLFALVFFQRIRVLFKRMDEAEGHMTTVLQENLTAIRVVRAFARQEFEKEKFAKRNGAFRDYHARFVRLLGVYWSSSDFLCLLQIGLVLIAGAAFVNSGRISVGTLAAFLEFEFLIIWPVRQMGRVLSETGKAVVAQGRLQEILQVEEESHLEPAPQERRLPLQGRLEVRDLSFGFPDTGAALSDISFTLEAGQTLALIGPPGSGKSTLIQLLLRLYDFEQGSIEIDGQTLASYPRRFLRSQFGVVLQEPFLYSRTVRANLALGLNNPTEEQLVHSTMAAAIHDSILEFTDGYETLVGERGVTLSGGQRQRIALARALLKEPRILVLDDALSAVDTETESRILEALEQRRGKQTTLLIASRLSSVLHADLILVLDQGRIQQAGTHADLCLEDGPYRRLWEIQGALEEEILVDLETADSGQNNTTHP